MAYHTVVRDEALAAVMDALLEPLCAALIRDDYSDEEWLNDTLDSIAELVIKQYIRDILQLVILPVRPKTSSTPIRTYSSSPRPW